MMHRLSPLNWELTHTKRRAGRLGLAALIVGMTAATWGINTYLDLAEQIGGWESKLAEQKRQARRESDVARASPRGNGELQQEIRTVKAVMDQIAVPWNELFRELETANDGTIALLAVQPEIQNHTVRISGEAKNLAAMLAYAEKLQQTTMLSAVYVSEHRVKEQDAQKPIEFSITALWNAKS